MSAAQWNLPPIEKYADWHVPMRITLGTNPATDPAFNLTPYNPRLQIRATPESTEILVELTVSNGGIVIVDAADGRLELRMTNELTASLEFVSAAYDLLIESTNDTRRLIQGTVTLADGVTR